VDNRKTDVKKYLVGIVIGAVVGTAVGFVVKCVGST
jgi:gas vesicle protein